MFISQDEKLPVHSRDHQQELWDSLTSENQERFLLQQEFINMKVDFFMIKGQFDRPWSVIHD